MQELHTKLLVGHLTAAKPQRDLDFVAVVEKLSDGPHLHVIIMRVDVGTHLDFLDLDGLLLLARLVRLFLCLVLELTVVHDLAHRRVNVWRNLNKIQPGFVSQLKCILECQFTPFFTLMIDDQYGRIVDHRVDARPFAGGRRSVKSSAYLKISCCRSVLKGAIIVSNVSPSQSFHDLCGRGRCQSMRSYEMPNGDKIAYAVERRRGPSFASAGLMWLGGFNSTMEGTKAQALARWARARTRECVRFDYSGHGASTGDFEDGTISKWLEEAEAIFNEITTGPQVLVGSSMGGWIALLLLRRHLANVRAADNRIRGIVLIAPAADMSEELMWKKFPDEIKQEITQKGVWYRPSSYDDGPYPITRALIEDGRDHLLLDSGIAVPCPVRILQGMEDPDVPWTHAPRILEALDGDDVTVTLIHGGDHRLSRDTDILRLLRVVERMGARADP